MATLVRASLLKLRKRTASWIVLGLLLLVVALVFLGVGASAGQVEDMQGRLQVRLLLAFPNAYHVILGIILSFGGLLALTYGAAVGGAEWAWGTIRSAIGRGESRIRYVLVLFLAVGLLVGVGVLVAFAVGAVMALLAAGMADVGTAGATDPDTLAGLPELLARTWLGVGEQAAIGFAVATLFRSQLAGIGAGLAVYFGELFLVLVPLTRDILPYLPFNVAQAVVTTAEGFGPGAGAGSLTPELGSTTAAVLAAGYLALALVVAAAAAWRAQITE
jgi:hypothetical protein